MRRFKIVIKRIILIFISIVVISILGLYLWGTNKWRSNFTVEEMKLYGKIVNESSKLSGKFYRVFDKVEPGYRHTSMNSELFNVMIELLLNDRGLYKKSSCCRNIFMQRCLISDSNKIFTKYTNRYVSYFFGWGMNKYSSPEKCFDYIFMKWHESFRQREICRTFYKDMFNRNLHELTENEIIEMILLWEGQTRYNKYISPENFNRRFNEVKELMKENYRAF